MLPASPPSWLETNLIQGPSANNVHQGGARGSDSDPKISGEGNVEAEGTVRKGYLEGEGRGGEDLRDRKVSQAETSIKSSSSEKKKTHNLGVKVASSINIPESFR